jgi:ribosome-associated protein
MRKATVKATAMTDIIVRGLFEMKGEKVALIDLRNIESRMCDWFVISHAPSTRQVDSLAWSVEDVVRKETGVKPYHVEGKENCIWVLLDYGDILVHIFQQPYRDFYDLESLWADGRVTYLEDNTEKKG